MLDGKVVKRVPHRLRPARQCKGGLLGGKGLVALHLRSGLALGLATDPDGEANDAKLVPDLLPQVRGRLEGSRLWLADRQFCDLAARQRTVNPLDVSSTLTSAFGMGHDTEGQAK